MMANYTNHVMRRLPRCCYCTANTLTLIANAIETHLRLLRWLRAKKLICFA
jgi:hypothetical protein